MDDRRFDHLARVVSHGASRRQLLGLLPALATTGQARSLATAQTSCLPGQADCDGVCIDTCCDNQNCGACGNVCTGGLTCFEGVCDCPSGLCCAEGETLCGETCIATCCDNNNCGACGNVCTGGLTCFEGQCSCPSGLCLPNTGIGSIDQTSIGASVSLALGSAAALVAVRLRRVNATTATADSPPPGTS